MIDLREDHLSRCVRSRGRRSEVREDWRRMRSQKKKEEEGGRQMQKETDFVRKGLCSWTPVQHLHRWGRNPHFSSTGVVCFGSLDLFFGARAHNYHHRGVRAPQRARSPREKNGNFSSSVKVLSSSSSSSCLLLSQTPGAAHSETSMVHLSWVVPFSASVHWY